MDLRLNRKAKATVVQLAAALVVGACTALMIVRTIDERAIRPPEDEQGLDARELAQRGVTGDMVFGPDFVPIEVGRTDVPWQAPPTVDPDHIRSF